MTSPPSLTTIIPAIRGISQITPAETPRTWHLQLNRENLRKLRLTSQGLAGLFRATDIEIIEISPNHLLVQLPTDQDLSEYLQSKLDQYLEEYRPRHLTESEIQDILASLPTVLSPIPEISQKAHQEIQERVRVQLERITITPLGIADLKNDIIRRFELARSEPGQTVGLYVAQALSALTQAALDARHSTGSRTAVTGLELLQDLLSVKEERNIETCTVHFWDTHLSFEEVYDKRPELIGIYVGNLVIDYIIDSPENLPTYWWVEMFPQLTGRPLPRTSSVVQIFLDKVTMYSRGIVMEEIAKAIESYNDPDTVTCVCGPFDSGTIFIYPDENFIIGPLQSKKIPISQNTAETFIVEILLPGLSEILIKGIPGIKDATPGTTSIWAIVDSVKPVDSRTWQVVVSSFRATREHIPVDRLVELLEVLEYRIVSIQDNLITIEAPNDENPSDYVARRVSQAEKIVDQFHRDRIKNLQARRKARLKGLEIPPVLEPSEEIQVAQQIQTAGKYSYLTTQGSNFKELLANREVDTTKTYCNNPQTILRFLGIEAARNLIIQEFTFILESVSIDLDPRHIILLSDFMTNRGVLLPLNFWGIIRQNPGPLTTSSFATAVDIFRTAAAFGRSEKIQSTTSAMFVGKTAKIGTGYLDVRLNEEKMKAFQEELAKKEQLGQAEIPANQLEQAIEQLDKITFGATEEPTGEEDIAKQLASLSFEENVTTTTKGQGQLAPPVETTNPAPNFSNLVEKSLEAMQVSGSLKTTEQMIEVEEKAAPTSLPKRVVRKPVKRTLLPATKPAQKPPAQTIPRARLQ